MRLLHFPSYILTLTDPPLVLKKGNYKNIFNSLDFQMFYDTIVDCKVIITENEFGKNITLKYLSISSIKHETSNSPVATLLRMCNSSARSFDKVFRRLQKSW